jgi:hypothetical protein
MKRISSAIVAVSSVVIASLLLSSTGLGSAAAAGTTQVVSAFITNDTTHPVPVVPQGTTQVSGNVNVGNTPSVKLDPTGNAVKLDPGGNTVKIDSSAGSPVLVHDVGTGQRPWSFGATSQFTGSSGAYADASYSVPSGYRFVIETLSATVALPSGQTVKDVMVNTGSSQGDPSQNAYVFLPLNNDGPMYCCQYYSGVAQVHIVATNQVTFSALRSDSTGSGQATYSAFGYLEPTS